MMCELLILFILLFILLLFARYDSQKASMSWSQLDQSESLMEGFLPFVGKEDPSFANYLYPTCDQYCQKIGYKTSNGPKLCGDKKYTLYNTNCRCVDNKDNCVVCWNPIKLNKKYK